MEAVFILKSYKLVIDGWMDGEGCDWQNIYMDQQHLTEHSSNQSVPQPKHFTFDSFFKPLTNFSFQGLYFMPLKESIFFLLIDILNFI